MVIHATTTPNAAATITVHHVTGTNPGITSQFGIRGIPTLILFKSGKPHAQKVGALSKSQLAAFVDSNL